MLLLKIGTQMDNDILDVLTHVQIMRHYPNADWAKYGDREMNYIDVKPRIYADLVVTTAPIRWASFTR